MPVHIIECESPRMYTLVQVGNGIELEAVGLQFEPYLVAQCDLRFFPNSRGNKAAENLNLHPHLPLVPRPMHPKPLQE